MAIISGISTVAQDPSCYNTTLRGAWLRKKDTSDPGGRGAWGGLLTGRKGHFADNGMQIELAGRFLQVILTWVTRYL